jgi:RNA-directed DNA polymerase
LVFHSKITCPTVFLGEQQMTVLSTTKKVDAETGATPTNSDHWKQLDWKKCQREVMRLQVRIAKATEENKWNKVKALQHLLTRSFSAKALAVKRVTSNKGRKTSGIDHQLWQSTNSKMNAIKNCDIMGISHSHCVGFIFQRERAVNYVH